VLSQTHYTTWLSVFLCLCYRSIVPYAVSLSKEKCFVASEERQQPGIAVDMIAGVQETLWTAPGGCMNVVADLCNPDVLWSIQGFYPVFDSEHAVIVRHEKIGGEWASKVMTHLPYAHRIALYLYEGRQYLIACQLCGSKAFRDDWSSPGAVYVACTDCSDGLPLRFVPVLEGLTKNHGLTGYPERGFFLVSCEQGVYRLWINTEAPWAEKLLDIESSEALLVDINGDGEDELITVNGFHGDHVNIRNLRTGEILAHIPACFCHVLDVAFLDGQKAQLTANRGGEKELMLHIPKVKGDELSFSSVVVDREAGATQATCLTLPHALSIYSANHDQNELALYEIRISK